MKSHFSLCVIFMIAAPFFGNIMNGQVTGIVIDTILVHDGLTEGLEDLEGYTTYRFYAECENSDDKVIAAFGDNESPLFISTEGDFYNSPFGGLIGAEQNPALFAFFLAAAYDSYVTIGLTEAPGAGEYYINTIESAINPWGGNFESGQDLLIDDITGGAWFVFPQGSNSTAYDENRVLLAQITANNSIHLQVNTVCLIHGEYDQVQIETLQASTELGASFGCTDPGSSNYDAQAIVNSHDCIPEECSLETEITNLVQSNCDSEFHVELTISSNSQFDYTSDSLIFSDASNFEPFYPTTLEWTSDFDGDGDIDVRDFNIFIPNWGQSFDEVSPYDSNGDGEASAYDLLDFLLLYGQSQNIVPANIILEGLLSGTYSLDAIDESGCIATLSFRVDEYLLEGDINGDNAISVIDLLEILSDFGCVTQPCSGDISGDGVTGTNDLLLILSAFGTECLQ